MTQTFNASSGVDYTLTAWAAETANGDGDPQCSITICGDDDCSSPFALETSYEGYSFVYHSYIDEDSAMATFQLECLQSGYVALDDVSISSDADSSDEDQVVPTATVTVYQTETIVQSQTSIQIETMTSISGSEVILTTMVPTIIYTTINDLPTIETRTVSSLLLSTAIATTAVPQYVNMTVSSVSTVTSKWKW